MKTVLALSALLIASPAAAADAPRVELSGGYTLARYAHAGLEGDETSNLSGWNGAAAFTLSRSLSAVADLRGQYGSLSGGTDFDQLSFLGGLRYSFRGARVTPFIQALGGGFRRTAGVSPFGGVNISVRSTDLGGLGGVGLDVALSPRLALRLEGDYALVKGDDETSKDPQFVAALVLKLGHR